VLGLYLVEFVDQAATINNQQIPENWFILDSKLDLRPQPDKITQLGPQILIINP
jgi:hypothetical protein